MTESAYDKGLKIRKQVLGEAHVNRSLANADDFSKPVQDLVTEIGWGAFWTTWSTCIADLDNCESAAVWSGHC